MFISLIIAVIVIGIFIIALYFTITSEKKRKIRKQETFLSLGFHPVREFNIELTEKLKSFYQKREHQKLELKEFYSRKTGDYELYLYEVWDHSGNDIDLQEEWGLAIYSPYLNLPRFSMIPRIDIPGKFASLANRFLEHLISGKEEKITFDNHLQFSKRYLVLGPDEVAIRHLFSKRILDRLSETKYWQADGENNLLTFSKFELHRSRKKGNFEQLKENLQYIKQLFQIMIE